MKNEPFWNYGFLNYVILMLITLTLKGKIRNHYTIITVMLKHLHDKKEK